MTSYPVGMDREDTLVLEKHATAIGLAPKVLVSIDRGRKVPGKWLALPIQGGDSISFPRFDPYMESPAATSAHDAPAALL